MHTRVTCLIADPQEPETLWAGVEINGIFRSRNLGRTWEAVGEGLSSRDIHALAFARADAGRWNMLAATNNDLNLSSDGGETWRPLRIGNSMPWSYCRTLGQPIGRTEEVLLGNGDGPPGSAGLIGRSIDGGRTWQPACMPGQQHYLELRRSCRRPAANLCRQRQRRNLSLHRRRPILHQAGARVRRGSRLGMDTLTTHRLTRFTGHPRACASGRWCWRMEYKLSA